MQYKTNIKFYFSVRSWYYGINIKFMAVILSGKFVITANRAQHDHKIDTGCKITLSYCH